MMDTHTNRAHWLAEGAFGVMVHYLIEPKGGSPSERTADLNRTIDDFDLALFMQQFAATKADWLIFTIGQNTGYYNEPNSVLEELLPGRTPHRKLVSEIARSVKAMGKRFIAYLPVEVDGQSDEFRQAFLWNPEEQSGFLTRYLAFLQQYSTDLGLLNDGWWFDGAYDHIHKGLWDWADWCDAARAGNPDSIVALNDGAFCVGRTKPVSPLQDYHAGEVHQLDHGRIVLGGSNPQPYMPDFQYIDGVQWHALVPIDLTFNPAIASETLHYSDDDLLALVRGCRAVGGAVTVNVPIEDSGRIAPESAAQLARLGDALTKTQEG